MPLLIGGGLAAAGGVLKGVGSKKAGNQAADAAKEAARTQQIMYMQTRADLAPFVGAGGGVLPAVNALALSGPTGGGPDYLTQAAGERPLQMTQNQLEQTPGYQFTRDQGLKAVQSAAASRGLGISGAALKGAASYATNLANTTYKDQFNLQQQRFADLLSLNTGQQTNLTNQWGRLYQTAALGENAAAGLGAQGTALANNMGTAQIAAGTAQAEGTKGLTNSLASPIQDFGGGFLAKAFNQNTGTG